MKYLILVLFITVIFALLLKKIKNNQRKYIVFLVIVVMSIFIGLRTRYNDTYTYMYQFINVIPDSLNKIKNIDISLSEYPGFITFEIILKSCISNNPQVFIFITGLITTALFVIFYYKYSDDFSMSVYLYITGGLLMSSMGGIKQHLAMAIATIAIKPLLEKKYVKYFLIILFSSLFHPYILAFLILPLLMDKTWSAKIVAIISLTVIAALFYDNFIGFVVDFTNDRIGSDYNINSFIATEGMNWLRVLVFAVTPTLSFIMRKEINMENNPLVIISVNASIISFCFTIIAMFGGANNFGRLAYYFLPFTYIALPHLFGLFKEVDRKIIKIFCILFYFIFFLVAYKDFIYYNVFNYKWY